MTPLKLSVGYMPLVDAAPLIVAQEMGFAAEEGLELDLKRAPSWSSLRDMLSFGQVDAAHMLSPVPVAAALGLGSAPVALAAVSVLSVGGNVIGVNRRLEAKLREAGHSFSFDSPMEAGAALRIASDATLRIGVPFPFSMHAELVYYWLKALGMDQTVSLDIRTVPPPLMADAIGKDEIDAFCVGEPWGSQAVEAGDAALLLPASSIWGFAPEKVLAVREDWANTEHALTQRLIRAVWKAGRWLDQDGSGLLAAELITRPGYLDVRSDIVERSLTGSLTISSRGEIRKCDRFLEFHQGAANFPWRSQAQWIARQLAIRSGLDPDQAEKAASSVFRPDLFRSALHGMASDLPGASSKLEGSLVEDTAVASAAGHVILHRDAFFDGRIFEPIS